jgi:hypothetical protein
MTIYDYFNSQLPDYYDTMYLDGYTPEQILQAAHNTMMKRIRERQEAENEVDEVKITTVIKKR